jgi:hypothetical protein
MIKNDQMINMDFDSFYPTPTKINNVEKLLRRKKIND